MAPRNQSENPTSRRAEHETDFWSSQHDAHGGHDADSQALRHPLSLVIFSKRTSYFDGQYRHSLEAVLGPAAPTVARLLQHPPMLYCCTLGGSGHLCRKQRYIEEVDLMWRVTVW